ncbi:MAG: ABC transporter [Candidatus Omnitrophica bacterium CG11_big_fil_rev_8_21_14_0_20_63_9]|nr:MAG: ABC transporter [Candidatus Omnitrophica bacterium CG11_big_fil_rev_8_21_14_0_20_63_9]
MGQTLHPIEFSHVWKQYRLGSKQDSLRDAIPALLKRLSGRNGQAEGRADGLFWALSDVSFHVKKGETVGIIGPNGAGKSTILKMLSRICQQTRGQIHVKGRLAALIEVGAGFHPDLTGQENIYLNGTIMGLKRKEIDRLYDSIVEFSEIGKFLDMPVKRYSSGMSVRLGFSVAAHVDPEVMLIDEVLAVGDLSFQQKCFQRILDLKSKGTTIIFISHNLEAVQRICDRVILLDEGRVLRDGVPHETIAHYRQEAMRKQRYVKVWDPTGNFRVEDVSKDLEIASIQALDAAGQTCEEFETGRPLKIRVAYRAKRMIRQPAVTVTIERVDGLICHEASSTRSGRTWPSWEGSGTVTLDYPALNLSPNTYQIHATVYEGQNPAPVAQLGEPVYLQVTSSQLSRGAFHLEHGWSSEAN